MKICKKSPPPSLFTFLIKVKLFYTKMLKSIQKDSNKFLEKAWGDLIVTLGICYFTLIVNYGNK